MRSIWKDILIALFMGMVAPGIMLNLAAGILDVTTEEETSPVTQPTQAVMAETAPVLRSMPMLVRDAQGSVTEMEMEAYLVGVVLAEMPASFETEALKAQAVVARTYALKAYVTGGKHGDGSVCTQSGCCQGYITEAAYLENGGKSEGIEKIRDAVLDTAGYVLTYQGELIEATYFSCSGGYTEDAAAVWGTEFPYLQAVSSPGEEQAVHYTDTAVFSLQEFQNALGITLEGEPASWFGAVTYTRGGSVETMEVCGRTYSGTQLRALLGLRSAAFTATAEENQITVTTRGYGHRVGMSQYGADAMAVSGSDYREILSHYYQGTVLEKRG